MEPAVSNKRLKMLPKESGNTSVVQNVGVLSATQPKYRVRWDNTDVGLRIQEDESLWRMREHRETLLVETRELSTTEAFVRFNQFCLCEKALGHGEVGQFNLQYTKQIGSKLGLLSIALMGSEGHCRPRHSLDVQVVEPLLNCSDHPVSERLLVLDPAFAQPGDSKMGCVCRSRCRVSDDSVIANHAVVVSAVAAARDMRTASVDMAPAQTASK